MKWRKLVDKSAQTCSAPAFWPMDLRTWRKNQGTIIWILCPGGPRGQQSWLAIGWELQNWMACQDFHGKGEATSTSGRTFPVHNMLRKYHILGHGQNPSLESWLWPSSGHLHSLTSLVGGQLDQLSTLCCSIHLVRLKRSSHTCLINSQLSSR